MSGKAATYARADQLNRRLGAQQIDLFGSPAVHGGNAPAWRELPSETQDVLVNLMGHYGDGRYRLSPLIARRCAAGQPLAR